MKTIKIKAEAIDPTGIIYNIVDANVSVYDNYSRILLTIGEFFYVVTDDGETVRKMDKYRYCKINRIGDEKIKELKDFVVFEDRWITEHDKILIDVNGLTYVVEDFMIVEDSYREKRSAVKLDKLPSKEITKLRVL